MNRRAQILLNLERRLSAPAETLMDTLDVGAKTIANEIHGLNESFAGAATIRLDQGRYRLWVLDRDRYTRIRAELVHGTRSLNDPDTRIGYILNRLVRAGGPVTTEDLAREMSIGRSTAIVDLAKLRDQAEAYGISILGRPHAGIELNADEFALRLFLLDHHFQAVYSGYPVDDELAQPLDAAVAEFNLSVQAAGESRRWYTVLLDRVLLGHGLTGLTSDYEKVRELPAYDFGKRVADAVAARLQLPLDPAEAVFLALPIAGMHTPGDDSRLEHFPPAEETRALVHQILDEIASEMDVHIPPTAMLKEFVHHVTFMVNRLRFRVQLPTSWDFEAGFPGLNSTAAADLRTAYPVAHRMAAIAARLIEREVGVRVAEEELGFIATYFQVFLEERRTSTAPTHRVAVVTRVGRVSARLVQLQLEKIMAKGTQYTLLSLDETTPEILDAHDLVVATTTEPLTTSAALIRLAEVFDRNELLGHINRLRYDRQADMPLGAGARSLVVSMLDQQRFMTLDPNLDYRGNLEAMIDRLVRLGLLTEEFRARLAEREERATMALDPYVAFPHATLPVGAKKVVFAMGVIPRSVGEDGLRVIFLMGIPEKADYDDTILVDIYDEIIRLASDRAGLDRISRLTTYEQFFFHVVNNPEYLKEG